MEYIRNYWPLLLTLYTGLLVSDGALSLKAAGAIAPTVPFPISNYNNNFC